jgi:hypothetical protein
MMRVAHILPNQLDKANTSNPPPPRDPIIAAAVANIPEIEPLGGIE